MKKLTLFLGLIFITILSFSQTPQGFNYQAVVRDGSGEILANQSVEVIITLLQGTIDGTEIFTETHTRTTNDFGLINLTIGSVNTTDFQTIDWSDGPYFLSVNINGNPMGVTQLLSVPYALHAKTAESLTGEIAFTETDPLFTTWDKSTGISISENQISDLNHFTTSDETDPLFIAWDKSYNDLIYTPALLDSINAVLDTTNQFIRAEVDGDANNEIQNFSSVLAEGNDAGNNSIVNISQQGIGTATPKGSAALEIDSNSKGVLIPRMNTNDIQGIQNPEPGLIVMDTTNGVYNILVFDGLEWLKVINNSSSYGNLVLWNQLGSLEEIENSRFGENGTIIGSSYTFEAAYDGNGYVRTASGDNYVNFPGSVLQNLKEKGTVELWINPKVTNPVAYSYGVFALVGNIFGTNSHVYIAWGDGTSGTGLYGSVNFDGTGHQTPFESEQFVAEIGTPFHVALCWDVNGIDESSNTVRLYRDGVLVSAIDDTWDSGNTITNYEGFSLGLGPDGQGYDKFIVDELKVWDFAKTNYETFNGTLINGDLKVDGTINGEFEIDSIHVSRITGLLGQNYTMVFPQILDNTVMFELEGVVQTDVVIISGPGHETERISEPEGVTNGVTVYNENAGLTMEYPLIFETTNENDKLLIKEWFDEATPVKRSASIVIKNLAGTETGRWILLDYLPAGYEIGNDGRTRFTMVPSSLPDNTLECTYQDDFGSYYSYNPATDKLVEIEGVIGGGTGFTPAVEVNLDERTITLTMDFNEGGQIYDWAKMVVSGSDETSRNISIIESTNGTYLTETGRYNYYYCIPIKYEHIYGFGLNTKLKARIVIAYGFREEAL